MDKNTNTTALQSVATITELQRAELASILDDLQGEEAVDTTYQLTVTPNDESQQIVTLQAVLRFYSNVRYLVAELRKILLIAKV